MHKRNGFTLIELVVVISLILLLMTLLVSAASTAISASREAATKTTLRKVNSAIVARLGNIDRYILREKRQRIDSKPFYMQDPSLAYNIWAGINGFPQNKPLGEALAFRDYMKKALPMTFAEAGITAPPGHDPATENSEVLYWFLTEGFYVESGPPRELVNLDSSEIGDTDGDGLLEILDAWDNPIRFYRWPSRMVRPQPLGSEGTAQDETGAIVNLNGWILNYANLSPAINLKMDQYDEFAVIIAGRDAGLYSSQQFENSYHTIETWTYPILVSAGRDGVLGLFEPTDTANKGYLAQPNLSNASIDAMADDISSWELTNIGR